MLANAAQRSAIYQLLPLAAIIEFNHSCCSKRVLRESRGWIEVVTGFTCSVNLQQPTNYFSIDFGAGRLSFRTV